MTKLPLLLTAFLVSLSAAAGRPRTPEPTAPVRVEFSRAYLDSSPESLPRGLQFKMAVHRPIFFPGTASKQPSHRSEPVNRGLVRDEDAEDYLETYDLAFCSFVLSDRAPRTVQGTKYDGVRDVTFTISGPVERRTTSTYAAILIPVSGVPDFSAIEFRKTPGEERTSIRTGPVTIDEFLRFFEVINKQTLPHILQRNVSNVR